MIKNILFDFAETIAELKPTKEEILKDFLEQKNINLSKDSIFKTYKYLDVALPYSSVFINNNQDKKDFYFKYNNLLFTMLGLTHLNNKIEKEYFDFFVSIKKHWVIKENLLQVLNQIKEEGFSLSIISNFDKRLKDVVENLGLNDIFDYVYISQEVGLEKPNIEFYNSFFKLSKYDISETIYIGDSYLLDYVPAKKIGLNVYLLDENSIYPHINDNIKSILDIKKLIRSI